MANVVRWTEDPGVVELIVSELRGGGLVALPTEAGYEVAASALRADAVGELTDLSAPGETPALLLGRGGEVFDWLPCLRAAGLRLIRRCWPGPLTLVSDAGPGLGLARRLPRDVQATVMPAGALALRLPEQGWVQALPYRLAEPVVLAPLPAFPLEAGKIGSVRDELDLIVDGGPSTYLKPPTVVRPGQRSVTVLREGALAAADLHEAARCRLVFVCTGNTCRSPLAQALCSRLLADTLGCAPAQLAERGFCVQSAGLGAIMGSAATPEAVAVARDHGADLSCHSSQPLAVELLAQADRLFAMTSSHLAMLYTLPAGLGPTPELLSPAGADVDDPIGAPEEVYRACAQQILEALRQRLPELLEA